MVGTGPWNPPGGDKDVDEDDEADDDGNGEVVLVTLAEIVLPEIRLVQVVVVYQCNNNNVMGGFKLLCNSKVHAVLEC